MSNGSRSDKKRFIERVNASSDEVLSMLSRYPEIQKRVIDDALKDNSEG